MSERGEYRAIRRVLLDGKDFRRLSERARWVFVALKLNLGPAGIDTYEPEALVVTLAAQTGAPPDGVRTAMAELEREAWIRREENVVWVIEQLTFDPHIKQKDPKHRASVQRHVAGLPSLDIVSAFAQHYEPWFEDADGPLKALLKRKPTPRRPKEGPSKGLSGETEGASEGHRSTEDNNKNKPDSVEDWSGNWIGRLTDHIIARMGEYDYSRVGKAFASAPRRFDYPLFRLALTLSMDHAMEDGKPGTWTPEKFMQASTYWVGQAGKARRAMEDGDYGELARIA